MFLTPIQPADIRWEDNAAPVSVAYGDVYFSRESGLLETEHVFLAGNKLQERLGQADSFTIGETGFGTGLNFLLACRLFEKVARPNAHLHFLSIEKHPLSHADIERALAAFPEVKTDADELLRSYPPAIPGLHRIHLSEHIHLTLAHGDGAEMLPLLEASVDAWFLDGFAPAKNPDMWNETMFSQVKRLSHIGTTAATFTVAGAVQRGLRAAGFTVEKVKGFGRKREMLVAEKTA